MSSPDSFRDIGTLAGGGQPVAPHLPTSTLAEQLPRRAADAGVAQDRPNPSHDDTVQDDTVQDGIVQDGARRVVDVRHPVPVAVVGAAPVVRDVAAVVREPRTGVHQDTGASRAGIRDQPDGSRREPAVVDDGAGQQGTTRCSGPDDLRRRAERYGGHRDIDTPTEGGLTLLWAISL